MRFWRVAAIMVGILTLATISYLSFYDLAQTSNSRAKSGPGPKTDGATESTPTVSPWSVKRDRWTSRVGGLIPPFDEKRSQSPQKTASLILNFELQLPTDPRSSAAGPPTFWAYTDTIDRLALGKLETKPPKSREGPQVIIVYPNGFEIMIRVMNPEIYEGYFEGGLWAAADEDEPFPPGRGGYRLVHINGLLGTERKTFFNDDGAIRQAVPPMITWYDAKNWVEYRVQAPDGASLTELREVVESIY